MIEGWERKSEYATHTHWFIHTRSNRNIIHFKTYLVTENRLNFFFASFFVTIWNQSFYWLCAIVIVKLTVLIEVSPFFPYFRFNQIFYSLFSFLLFYCELKDPIIWLDFYISIISTVRFWFEWAVYFLLTFGNGTIVWDVRYKYII